MAGGPPAAAAAGVMLKPHPTVVGNAKNGFAVYSCASPVYQPMTVPVNPAQCYPLTSQCRSAQVITPLPIGKRSSVISVSVCLCVCLYVRDHISGTTRPIFTNFLRIFPMAVARSSSGGIVMRYVLPVLWMTSRLLISQRCSTSPPS